MRLRNLYDLSKITEADLSNSDLKPGERKDMTVNNSLEDMDKLKKLSSKISDYEASNASLSFMKVPQSARDELAALKEKTFAKVDSLNQELVAAKAETEVDGLPKPLNNLLEKIKDECSEYLSVVNELRGNYLYRGASTRAEAFKGRPYDSRKAKDSNQLLSNSLNEVMAELGFEARRDNSIFTSASFGQAQGYGTGTFIIFPINGYSYSWSTKESDMIFEWSRFANYFVKGNQDVDEIKEVLEKNKEKFLPYFDRSPYIRHNKNFESLFTGSEDFKAIGTLIDEGLLDPSFERFRSPKGLMTEERVTKNMGMTDSNLEAGLKAKHEIVVRGEYYAINTEFEHYVKQYLQKGYAPDPLEGMEVGSFVQVTKGADEGQVGKVDYISKYNEKAEVRKSDGTLDAIPFDSLKLISREEYNSLADAGGKSGKSSDDYEKLENSLLKRGKQRGYILYQEMDKIPDNKIDDFIQKASDLGIVVMEKEPNDTASAPNDDNIIEPNFDDIDDDDVTNKQKSAAMANVENNYKDLEEVLLKQGQKNGYLKYSEMHKVPEEKIDIFINKAQKLGIQIIGDE